MRKALVVAVAVVSFLAGAWLSPFVSASGEQDAVLLASLPSPLQQGQQVVFEPKASVACNVIRQNGTWVECENALYVNLITGLSLRVSPRVK